LLPNANLFRKMTTEQRQALFENTARSMNGVPTEIQQRWIGHCVSRSGLRRRRRRSETSLAAKGTKIHCVTATLLRRGSRPASMIDSRRKQRAVMAVSVGNMAHPTPRDAPIPALHGLHLTERIT
jgi:hypothetical protein